MLKQFYCRMLIIVLFFTGVHCTKDKPAEESPVTGFAISFPQGSIAAATVDSVIIMYTNSQEDTIKRKTFVEKDIIPLRTEDLPAGNWKLHAKLFTKPTTDTSRMMYRLEKTITLPAHGETIAAPTGKMYEQWKPAVVLWHKPSGIRLTIAERADDPYYEIFFPEHHPFNYLWLDRIAFDLSRPEQERAIAYGANLFSPAAAYTGNIIDTSSLNEFAMQMAATSRWDYTDIVLVSQKGYDEEERLLYHRINKRP